MSSSNLFRKKSLEKIQSPENLSDYIAVENPSAWMILFAVVILLAGICIWGIFGHIDTKLRTAAVSAEGQITCFAAEDAVAEISSGMEVEVNGDSYRVAEIAKTPVRASQILDDYAMHIGGLASGEWVYAVTVQTDSGHEIPEDGIYAADIITESVSPSVFVFN